MSLEQKIDELITALKQHGATVTSASADIVMAMSGQTDSGAKTAPADKKAPPKRTKGKVEEKPEDDLDLDSDPLGEDSQSDDLGLGEEEEVTKDMLREKLTELSKMKGGREAAADILKKFKATSFKDLQETHYAGAYAAAVKAIG